MNKIIIADEQIVARKGFELCCRQVDPKAHVSHCSTMSELYKILRSDDQITLLILNVYINAVPTIHHLENIRLISPGLSILLVGVGNDLVFGGRIMQSGFNGYVNKKADGSELVKAISETLLGKRYFPEEILAYSKEMFKVKRPIKHPFERLSDREFTVMLCLVNGMETSEIAETMSLQTTTVSTYKSRVFEKLCISRINDLKRIAEAYQIVLDVYW